MASQPLQPNCVLILPMWNWKRRTRCLTPNNDFDITFVELKQTGKEMGICVVWCFDSTLWNWNRSQKAPRQGFDGTSVELKPYGHLLVVLFPLSFDSTFVELKREHERFVQRSIRVSIVPLWNWKTMVHVMQPVETVGFSGTYVELKLRTKERRC